MRVLCVNKFDLKGGAAIASHRLHKGLIQSGIDSRMLVQQKSTDDRTVLGPKTKFGAGFNLLRKHVDNFPLVIYRNRKKKPFFLQWLPNSLQSKIDFIDPDIIHLNWICGGYIPINALAKFNKPIVWTFHDMWAFTGGCCYSGECTGYVKHCGKCPQLGSRREKDLSFWGWQRKKCVLEKLNLTIVTPSKWMGDCAAQSSLLKDKTIRVIPNGIDLNRFKPLDQSVCRNILGLPLDKKLVLFGAVDATSDLRKGFHYLSSVFAELKKSSLAGKTELVVFGAGEPENPPELGFKATYLGRLYDEISIALLYSAVDVFIVPSLEDNLPNTVLESMACGTPCVAFTVGGLPDMIDHLENGYLAKALDASDLANGLHYVLNRSDVEYDEMRINARQKAVRDYDIQIVSERYKKLYEEIIY